MGLFSTYAFVNCRRSGYSFDMRRVCEVCVRCVSDVCEVCVRCVRGVCEVDNVDMVKGCHGT